MANIKSQIKRAASNDAANKVNNSKKNALRTAIKKVDAAVAAGNKEEALLALKAAVAKIDVLAREGVISVNSASRKKSSLQKKVNALA